MDHFLMKQLAWICLLALIVTGCKSHKTGSKTEQSEKTKSEQVITQVDSSSTQTLRIYAEAIQSNYDRGTAILFDSLSMVTIEPSGIIRAIGFNAWIIQRDTSSLQRYSLSAEANRADSVSRRGESKIEESQSTTITEAKEVKRGFPWWILFVVAGIAGLLWLLWPVLKKYLKPF